MVMTELGHQESKALTIRNILGIRDFRYLWLGQIVSNFGDALTHLTLVLLINRITGGSTAAIAYLLIALALPHAVIGLFAGVLVDRLDRKRIMVVSDIVRGFLILAFIVVVLAGTESLWPIYIIGFLTSAAGAFFLPARSATIPNIVPREGLLSANSLSQTSFVLFRVLGATAAGLIIGLFDVFWLAFVIDAATFFASAAFISQIQLPRRKTDSPRDIPLGKNIRSAFGELGEGLSIIARSRALMGTLVAAGVAMLGVGALSVLFAPFIVNDIGLSVTWFGFIESAQVAGMLVSGTVVAVLAARLRPTHLISIGLVALGITTMALAAAYQVWQLVIVLFAVGLSVTPINASIATLIQVTVEDRVRGRIMAALGAIVQVTSIVSMLAAGILAAQLGTRYVFVLSGIIAVAAGLLSAWVYKGFRLPKPEHAETAVFETASEPL